MQIFCVNTKKYVDVPAGSSLAEIFSQLNDQMPGMHPICAHVNNKTENLSFQVFAPKQIEFLDSSNPSGNRVYIRSLCMMLYKAVTEVFPDASLAIEHSISRGYYCRLASRKAEIPINPTEEQLAELKQHMLNLHLRDIPFERHEKLTKDVIEIFFNQGLHDKVQLLKTVHDLYTVYYTLDGLADSYYGPLAPSTGSLPVFDIVPFKEGFLLMGRDQKNRDVPQQKVTQEKMYHAFTDYLKFNHAIRVSNVGDLNRAVRDGKTARLINVAEAMHDKLLGRISDEISRRREKGEARIVLLAGPSSSGKTTTTKRLAIQLMTNLISPKMISLDDYFIDRAHTPLDEDGEYDYESLYALDLERLHSDLRRLLNGETINLPSYSFELGTRVEKERPMVLNPGDVLLIEGIHGLNPELTAELPSESFYKIYVSALTTLRIDDHNWIPTTDNRLLRRIVRDHKYRHTSALDTIRRWASVRRGEEKWIFPYQENADATFNSSLIFELGAMKKYAEPMLNGVPHDVPEYAEAYRLLRFLGYFEQIPDQQIPSTSLLREFLGGSSFRY